MKVQQLLLEFLHTTGAHDSVSPPPQSYYVTFTEMNYNFIRHVVLVPKLVRREHWRQSPSVTFYDGIKVRLNNVL
jgi:hypothetical protein